ncbi:hypothetical protein MUU72_21325 [Streptomyces sp. RS10V-4]|uniref:hypothetical protein n=1 Tax=Streptomyces rhizoryzae TaxID=2932493 RepID=UPI002006BB79|nr:hypothetical protein [Streptomyces rhizoryzae]MCK7625609.1 hypothetical protein [Streptomyces rhizoryzae]
MALTRRTTLLAGAALGGAALLAGCADDSAGPAPESAEQSAAAQRTRARAARDSRALLARYDATLAAHPGLGARLRPLRTEVARHAEAFTAPAPSASPSPGRAPAPVAPRVPAGEQAARTALADAERTLADARTTALRTAPPELARLLASVAAAGAAHAYLLTAPG